LKSKASNERKPMDRLGIHQRHRDKNGELSRKHGNTLIGTLRKIYGPGFGRGAGDRQTLSDVLGKLDEESLSQLVRDHEGHVLTRKLSTHVA
jgi:hypothetical protein